MDSAYNNKTNDESKIVRLRSTTGIHRTPPHASNGDILDMNNAKPSKGEFWMPFRSWVNTFTHLEVVHLDGDTSRDEPSLQDKIPWVVRLYQGQWRKGVTAGGCRNFTGELAQTVEPSCLLCSLGRKRNDLPCHDHKTQHIHIK